MKTNDLIEQLLAADPSGKEEVSVGNHDIHYVSREPAYYDGCQQVLKRDTSIEGYNIVGAEIRGHGTKIVINSMSIDWALLDNPDLPVTFADEYAAKHYPERVREWREKNKKIIAETQ